MTVHAKRVFPDYGKVVDLGITAEEITTQAIKDMWERIDRAARGRVDRFRVQSSYVWGP